MSMIDVNVARAMHDERLTAAVRDAEVLRVALERSRLAAGGGPATRHRTSGRWAPWRGLVDALEKVHLVRRHPAVG